MKELNVIVVNDFGNINGGAAKVAIQSAIGLSKTKASVYYLCASGKLDRDLEESNFKEIKNLNQEHLIYSKNKVKAVFQGFWNRRAEQAMLEMLYGLDKKKTIIHVHGWTKSLSVSCISAALKLGFPIVITLHDFFIYCPNGGFYNFKDKYICRKKPLSISCLLSNCDSRSYFYKIHRIIRSIIERNIFRKFKTKINFIALSKLSYDVLEPYISGFKSTKFIENPIDAIKLPQVDVVKNNKIVFIGRLSYEKGAEYFCKASELIDFKDAIIIGEGPDMDRLVKQYQSVNFIGWQNKDQIFKVLQESRALVFPSVWYETYGLVVQEAASHGIPVIISDCTAACEFVKDGYNGLIFKSKDVSELVNKLNIIINDDTLTSFLGRNAYNEFWSKEKGTSRHVSCLIDYYQEILRSEPV